MGASLAGEGLPGNGKFYFTLEFPLVAACRAVNSVVQFVCLPLAALSLCPRQSAIRNSPAVFLLCILRFAACIL